MSLFKRRKNTAPPSPSPPAPAAQPIAGVPTAAIESQDFDVVIRQLIKQMAPAGSEIVETGNDSVMVASSEINFGNLRNGWNHRQPGDREVWLRDSVHGFLLSELRDQSKLDLSMLRPGIRSEWYLNVGALTIAAQRGQAPMDHGMAHRRLGAGLVRVLLWDTPTTMAIITDSQIAEWGSDFDQLWSVAVDNLAADPAKDGWGQANKCCWTPVHTDDYTAERMFIDGHLDRTGLAGEIVMFHPTREALFLADPNDAAGIELAAQMAMSKASEPNPVTLLPYIGRGLSWRPLELPTEHPAASAVDRLRLAELSNSYTQQQELLATIHGDDMFVATYQAFQVDDRTVTLATWTEGAVSLLPTTDLISFVRGLDSTPESIVVDWKIASQIVGDRLERTNHWPERWRVTTFPAAAELDQLRASAAM